MADGKVVDGGVTAETTQTMKNLATQLATVGASLSDIVKTTCFLTDMENFAAFNEAYAEALGDSSSRPIDGRRGRPARRLPGRGRGLGLQARSERQSGPRTRCSWALSRRPDDRRAYVDYHDEVWGVPQRDPSGAVRVPDPRRCPGGPVVVDDPAQDRRVPRGLRRLRPRGGGGVRRRRRRALPGRRRHRAQSRQGHLDHRQRPRLARSSTIP